MGPESTDQPDDSKRPGVLGWLLWSLVIFLVYMLSIGPATRLEFAGVLPAHLVDTVYAPIYRLGFGTAFGVKIYVWYLSLWGVPVAL